MTSLVGELCACPETWLGRGMTKKKDDPREVDWAARRIRELSGKVNALQEVIGYSGVSELIDEETVMDVILRLEGAVNELKVNVFTDTGFNRSTEVSKRVTSETQRINRLRDQVERMSENFTTKIDEVVDRVRKLEDNAGVVASQSTDRVLNAHNERISRLESRLNAYGVPEIKGEYVDRRPQVVVDPTLPEGTAVMGAGEPEFSPPIGSNPENARRIKVPSVPHSYGPSRHPLDRGVVPENRPIDRRVVPEMDNTRDVALYAAAQRVEKYMTGHFSSATIEGVLRALKGDDVPPVSIVRDGDLGALHGSTEVRSGLTYGGPGF